MRGAQQSLLAQLAPTCERAEGPPLQCPLAGSSCPVAVQSCITHGKSHVKYQVACYHYIPEHVTIMVRAGKVATHSRVSGSWKPFMNMILYVYLYRSGPAAGHCPYRFHADVRRVDRRDPLFCHLCCNIAWEDGTDTDAIVAQLLQSCLDVRLSLSCPALTVFRGVKCINRS